MRLGLRWIKRIVVLVLGLSVLLVGVVMMVAPGPAIVVIPIGLAILATEFVWAKRLLDYFKLKAQQAGEAVRNGGWGRKNGAISETPVSASVKEKKL